MESKEILELIISSLGLIVIICGLYFTVRSIHLNALQLKLNTEQLKASHEWNRRKSSQEFLYINLNKDLVSLREKLEKKYNVDIYDDNQDYTKILNSIETVIDKKDFEFTVTTIFNSFEVLAVGIKNHVLDNDICFDFLAVIYTRFWKWGYSFIKKTRADFPSTWIDFEYLAEKWGNEVSKIQRPPDRQRTQIA